MKKSSVTSTQVHMLSKLRMKWLCSLMLAVLCSQSSAGRKCPPQDELKPHCWCYERQDGGSLLCQDFNSPTEVVLPLEACRGYDVVGFNVQNSTLTYFPHDVFVGTTFAKISLFNTVLMSLSNGPLAFAGLEDTMEELRASQAEYAASWNLDQLKKLKKMQLIDLNNIRLEAVEDEFSYLPQLKYIGLDRAEISSIGDKAFSYCPDLTILHLAHNELTDVKRSMLPKPASRLTIIRLDGNELTDLPPDFFTDMPSLEDVYLASNKFITISENTFGKTFSKLKTLELRGNPLHCDCRMTWLVDVRKSYNFNAQCESPPSLKGTLIRNLKSRDIHC